MSVDLSGLLIAGRYRLTRQIGKGGMGTVWIAVQQPLGRDIALKLIRPELAHEARVRERFRREAKLVAQLSNPHIVTVIDFGETEAPGGGTTLFIAMELLRGRTLRERLREGPMSPRETAEVVREIADALVTAHEAGVVHRDLKPDNVMLAESPQRPASVKLVDFGVAKCLTPEAGGKRLTQTGVLVGTPGYLAPEVVLGDEAAPASDLYSLGVMWFEMLARRQPFAAQTPMALAMLHATEPAPRLRSLVPSIPVGLAALVDELLAKEPAERPASAAEVVARVDALLAAGLESTVSPTVELDTLPPAFDNTRLQVFQTTSDRPATPQPVTQRSVRTATMPPPLRDTRPDPATQPSTLRIPMAPALRVLMFAAGGAVLALGVMAAVLLASSPPSVEPVPPEDNQTDDGPAVAASDGRPPRMVDAGVALVAPADLRPPRAEPRRPPDAPPLDKPPLDEPPLDEPPPDEPPLDKPPPDKPPSEPPPFEPRLEL